MLADFYFLAAAANFISMWMPNFYRAHSSYAPCAESHLNVAFSNIYHNSSGRSGDAAGERPKVSNRIRAAFQVPSSLPGIVWAMSSVAICWLVFGSLAGCNLLMARLVLAVLTFKPCRVCRDIELWRFLLFFWFNFYLAFAVKTQIYWEQNQVRCLSRLFCDSKSFYVYGNSNGECFWN